MADNAHGFIGTHLQAFTTLLPAASSTYSPHQLAEAAKLMKSLPDTLKDGADPEENLWVPAGYTYFGQFVDHDLTFDSTSSLNLADMPPQGSHVPSNLRTPRFDLDNVYGDGPDAQPYMYDADGATLLTGDNDLLRAPNGRAIIGDKRNDENSIVCQIQLGVIRYHNKVVAALKAVPPAGWNVPGNLFASAQNEVRWTYQLIVVKDFLPRIVADAVLADLRDRNPQARAAAYVLYTPDKRDNLPREFVGAAYRYGHSGVRTGYRLNAGTILSIFPGSTANPSDDSLLGFDPLPTGHIIDHWDRFFPATAPGADVNMSGRVAAEDANAPMPPLLQFAYKIDTSIVDPLGVLPPAVAGGSTAEAVKAIAPDVLPDPGRPSLALLNLLRGNAYALPSGQSIAQALLAKGKPVKHLDADQVCVRVATDQVPATGNPNDVQAFQWVQLPSNFHVNTPLWLYTLMEAQGPLVRKIAVDGNRVFLETVLLNGAGAATQLGWVAGRIIAEVFYGLLDADDSSVFNHPAAVNFKPRLGTIGNGLLCFRNLLEF